MITERAKVTFYETIKVAFEKYFLHKPREGITVKF